MVASAAPDSGGPRMVLVGSRSPLGREVKRRLEKRKPALSGVSLAEVDALDDEGGRLLGDFAGEALLLSDAREIDFRRFQVAVLLGCAEEMSPLLEGAHHAETSIDASGASQDREGVPWVQWGLGPADAIPAAGPMAVPQPVAATLARLLHPLAASGLLQRASSTVLLPAAALSEKAVDELYRQALGLLNFTELPQDELKRQLAFNILPWESSERAGSGSLATDLSMQVNAVLGEAAVPFDLQLLLASSFHGYGYSVRLHLERALTAEEIGERLRECGVDVSRDEAGPVSPVEALERTDVLVSRIRSVSDRASWLWAVADSLGAAAENVARLVEHQVQARVVGREA